MLNHDTSVKFLEILPIYYLVLILKCVWCDGWSIPFLVGSNIHLQQAFLRKQSFTALEAAFIQFFFCSKRDTFRNI